MNGDTHLKLMIGDLVMTVAKLSDDNESLRQELLALRAGVPALPPAPDPSLVNSVAQETA